MHMCIYRESLHVECLSPCEVKTAQTFIFLTNLTFHFHDRCGFSCCRLFKLVRASKMVADTPKMQPNTSWNIPKLIWDHPGTFQKKS